VDLKDLPAVARFQAELKEHDEIAQRIRSSFQTALNNYKNRKAIFDDGFLAMLALSESGRTVCKFEDAWLWQIEP
jgi:hypothetical protein